MRWFVPFIALVLCAGCASAPHPLLRAFAPQNLPSNLAASTTIEARISASADLPFLPAAYISAETRDERILIKIRPPFNTTEFLRIYREELRKRGHKNVDIVAVKQEGAP